MSDHRIPEEMAQRAARLINEAEDMRAQAVDDLKTIYDDLREELKSLGWRGAEVSEQVAAFKAAIAETRLDDEKKAKREAKDGLVAEYINVLSSRARARVRALQSDREHDVPVVHEPAECAAGETSAPIPAGSHDQHHELVEGPEATVAEDAVAEPVAVASAAGQDQPEMTVEAFVRETDEYLANSNPRPNTPPVEDMAGDPQDGNEAVSGSPAAPINPLCQKPETCRWAHGTASCSACNQAHELRKAGRVAA